MDGRPDVTVTDPAAPGAGADVLGDDEPRSSRRPLLVLLAAGVLLGAVAVVGDVRERRAADALERELASTVDLVTEADLAAGGSTEGDDLARLELAVGVRNAGPRPVRLLGARLGDFVSEVDAEIAPGGISRVALRLAVDCRQEPGPLAQDGPLLVDVRTQDGAESRVALAGVPAPFDPQTSAQLCGYLPLEQALGTFTRATGVEDGAQVELVLGLFNQSRDDVVVEQVSVVDGLSLQVLGDLLPLTVPSGRPGGQQDLELPVRLRVDDCDRLVRPGDGDVLRLRLSAPGQEPIVTPAFLDGVGDFLLRACPRG